METIVMDKFCYRSNAASAQIIRQKVRLGRFGSEPKIFCTQSKYKDSVAEQFPEDANCVTKHIINFSNIFLLYMGTLIYVWSNRKSIHRIISMSSPGTNLYLMCFLPKTIKIEYFVQDVFPDGKLWALGLYRLNAIHRFFSMYCYKRVNELIAISEDISRYLKSTYGVDCIVEYNESTMPRSAIIEIRNQYSRMENSKKRSTVLFSGNFSHAHGYERAMRVFEALIDIQVDLRICGFGHNYEKAFSSGRLPLSIFGSSMGESEYKQALVAADVFVVLQGDGYQNFCFSSKYTSLKPLGKRFIYVGPKCSMSREIQQEGIGVCIHGDETPGEIRARLEAFVS